MRKLMLLLVCMCLAVVQLYAQNRTVTGKVTDEKGAGLAGVTVTASSSIKSVTNESGNFSISVPANIKSLEFSYLGYGIQKVAIGSGVININLSPVTESAGTDVVVTGYSRVERSKYTGSAGKVGKEKINLVPMASFDQILQGRVPGLVVLSGSGQPGAAANVTIRGRTSILGGSTPLYVVDGIPVEASVFQSYNTNDFESVDVLKDAVAQSLYGSRGAAGVIVVTTKKGRAGKTVFSYRGQYGITEPGKQRFDMMNSSELLAYQEKLGVAGLSNTLPGWVNSPLNPTYATATPADKAQRNRNLDSLRGINTNWQDHFMRKGSFSSHDLNMSGGSEKTRFFASTGIYDEDGIGQRSFLKRYTFRANVDHIADKFIFSLNSTVGYTKRSFIEGENATALNNPFAAAYLAVPYKTLYNAAGALDANAANIGAYAQAYLESRESRNEQTKANLVANLSYNIYKDFYIGGQAGVDYRQTNAVAITKPGSYAALNATFPTGPDPITGIAGGSYTESNTRYTAYNSRAFVAYRGILGSKHVVDVSANMEYIERRNRSMAFTGYGLNPKFPNAPVTTAGTVTNQLIPAVSGANSRSSILSYFGVAKYSFDNKYTLDFSVRRDGASILPEKNRWHNFYAVGGSWNVLRENFAANWRKINTLRVRASYGQSANEENFPGPDYYPVFAQGSYAGQPTWALAGIGNPDADWEYTNQANVGIDFGFFKNRLTGNVDVYNKITKGNYIDQSLPAEAGGGSLSINAGKLRNKGVEFAINYDIVRSKSVTWSIGGNIAYNKNEVTSLGQVSEFIQGTAIVREGLPLGTHYEVRWAGVDAATGQALYYTRDGKLTNVYNNDNQAVAEFGTSDPPTTGGFNTTVNFKGIEVGAFFSFMSGYSRYNNQDFFQLNHSFAIQGYNMRREAIQMWTKPGDVTNIQSPLTQRQFSSKDIQDASYLRFRNLSVAYNVPKNILGRQNIVSNVRIYGQAQNLYTWTKWTGFDPEDNNNIAQYEYPAPRTFTVGIDVSF